MSTTSPVPPSAPPTSGATFEAPTKVCPHCGAMAQTVERNCPSCGKKYKKRTVLKVLLGLSLVGLVFIVGCAALIGSAANEAVKQLDSEQKAHAISVSQFRSLTLGTSESEVISQLGKKPEDRQEFQNESFVGKEPDNSSCIYYNKAGGSFGDAFQLCFDNSRLSSKNAY
jgi:hypothetical protein